MEREGHHDSLLLSRVVNFPLTQLPKLRINKRKSQHLSERREKRDWTGRYRYKEDEQISPICFGTNKR